MNSTAVNSHSPIRRHRFAITVLVASLSFIDCGLVPRDNVGTLDRVRGGELRVGITDHPPWVRVERDRVVGIEPQLIERWAQQLGAKIRWRRGAEAELIEALHRRELDVLAAGLHSDTPYRRRVALTRPYLEFTDPYGSNEKHVLAVMPGESALLLALDRFLAVQDKAALRRHAESQPQSEGGRQP